MAALSLVLPLRSPVELLPRSPRLLALQEALLRSLAAGGLFVERVGEGGAQRLRIHPGGSGSDGNHADPGSSGNHSGSSSNVDHGASGRSDSHGGSDPESNSHGDDELLDSRGISHGSASADGINEGDGDGAAARRMPERGSGPERDSEQSDHGSTPADAAEEGCRAEEEVADGTREGASEDECLRNAAAAGWSVVRLPRRE